MNEEVMDSFRESMSDATNEVLFNDIPSRMGAFCSRNPYNSREERKPLTDYLMLIRDELSSRSNRYGEEYLNNSLSIEFCTDKLFPRWLDAFEVGGLVVFDILEEVGLLGIVINQLSTVLECDWDINSVITKLFKRGVLLGIILTKETQSTKILRSM
jgi:hypothetical protein